MGACNFSTFVRRQSVDELPERTFDRAVKDAQWEHGHGGYTGTIAEKRSFVTIEAKPHTREEARNLSNKLMDKDDRRICGKWGPAGAIRVVDGEFDGWLFFGWASE